MKQRLTIDYNWRRPDGVPVKESHHEALQESAEERIAEMMAQGYVEGELHDNIHMDDDDPKDGIAYRGWWKMSRSVTAD